MPEAIDRFDHDGVIPDTFFNPSGLTSAPVPGLYIQGFTHKRRVNSPGRQTCCNFCHECGDELHTVLDGEKWCPKCEAYR